VDDTPDGIEKSLAAFAATSEPILAHYAAQGKVKVVPAVGDVEEVYAAAHELVAASDAPEAAEADVGA